MSDETITLTIDGQPIEVAPGTTYLEAAEQAGIDIPHICVHDALTPPAVCRMCVVEVEGAQTLPAACVAQARDGDEVSTRSERVERSRRTILEMLDSAVDLSEAPEIQAMMAEYDVDRSRFNGSVAKRDFEVKDDNPFYIRDYSQCVMCWRCVQVCADDGQYAYALNFGERGFHSHIATFDENPMPDTTCVFCGLCVGVCPTGALKPKTQWGVEQGFDPDKIRQMTRRERRRKTDKG
jgi:NADH dehydrogenase/NADH:ubiquinone oxidoreductase subunit G